MTKDQISQIKIGDRIKFSSPTRGGAPTATRIVTGFTKKYDWKFDDAGDYIPGSESPGEPEVRFHGHGGFVVHFHEINEHFPA